MTEPEYQAQNLNCERSIQFCFDDIREKSRQIEELHTVLNKLQKVGQSLTDAAAGKRKIDNLFSTLLTSGCLIKGKFFGDIAIMYTGAEYRKSCEGVEEASRRVYQKLDELQDQINARYAEIGNYEQQIAGNNMAIAALAAEGND